ncbi:MULTISPECIES: hypothetical protein [Photorhabdus]|uniref:hypothetical protein n=1 Tax=Photorhabdus TaxID=29487 RepID=UPI000AD3F9DC|nr:hypothetical protein [Photorhabdus luminescens]
MNEKKLKAFATEWENLNTLFGYLPDVRKAIYTANNPEFPYGVVFQFVLVSRNHRAE